MKQTPIYRISETHATTKLSELVMLAQTASQRGNKISSNHRVHVHLHDVSKK